MSITFDQFNTLLKHIAEHNGPFSSNGDKPSIKYADPVIDFRTQTVFAIRFRHMGGGEITFNVLGAQAAKKPLYDYVLDYLNTVKSV